jgi:hypothetical protein
MPEMFEGYPELAAQMERASDRITDATFRLMERRLAAYSEFFAHAGRSFAPGEAAGLSAHYFERMMGDYGAAFTEMLAAWPAPILGEGAPAAPPVDERLAEAAIEAEVAMEAAPETVDEFVAEEAVTLETPAEAGAEAPTAAAEEPASFEAAPTAKPSRSRRQSEASANDEAPPPTH